MVDCSIGSSTSIRFLIDSGADVNVIGGQDWEKLEREARAGLAKIEMLGSSSSNKLHAYGSHEPMTVACTFKASIVAKTSNPPRPTNAAVFHVIPKGNRSLLGRSTANDLGLLQIINNVNHKGDDGIFPKMPGVKVTFSVDKDVPPTKSAYYNVPAAYR